MTDIASKVGDAFAFLTQIVMVYREYVDSECSDLVEFLKLNPEAKHRLQRGMMRGSRLLGEDIEKALIKAQHPTTDAPQSERLT